MNNKYEKIKSLLQNGDICEFKTCDSKVYFAFYMDGYFYKKQENRVVAAIGGYEPNITAIRRPECLRNAFQCFVDGDIYNYDYSKYGAFKTIYDEDQDKEQLFLKFTKWLKVQGKETMGLQDIIVEVNGQVHMEKRMGTKFEIAADDWIKFCDETNIDYNAIKLIAII